MRRDLVCGLIALIFAAAYLIEASKIPSSALGDTVGSEGFPQILGWLLIVTAALLIAQALLARTRVAATASPGDTVEENPRLAFTRAAGLLLIAAAFLVALPFLGYIVSVSLMLAAVMFYQGIPLSWRLASVAVGGALILFGLFKILLGIPMPSGLWAGLFG